MQGGDPGLGSRVGKDEGGGLEEGGEAERRAAGYQETLQWTSYGDELLRKRTSALLLYYPLVCSTTPLLRTALKVPRLERDRGTNPALYARRWCLLSFISIDLSIYLRAGAPLRVRGAPRTLGKTARVTRQESWHRRGSALRSSSIINIKTNNYDLSWHIPLVY